MESMTKMFIRARESVVRNTRGQTMTEYALILAAIAVVVYGDLHGAGQQHRFARQWRRFRSDQRITSVSGWGTVARQVAKALGSWSPVGFLYLTRIVNKLLTGFAVQRWHRPFDLSGRLAPFVFPGRS